MCGDIIKCFTIVVITILLDDVSIILKGDGMYTQYIAIALLHLRTRCLWGGLVVNYLSLVLCEEQGRRIRRHQA